MKKTILVVITLFLICTFGAVEAQTLSKSERKALKKEIKTYKKNPQKWVTMQNRHKKEVTTLSTEVVDLKAELDKLRAETEKSRTEKQELADKLAALEGQYAALKQSMPSTELPDGVVYQVQMGYYQNLDLLSFNSKLKTIKAEDTGGAKRYVIGYFENMMDALQFSNDIKSLGISDAFVSQYINGSRNMEFDALQSLGN